MCMLKQLLNTNHYQQKTIFFVFVTHISIIKDKQVSEVIKFFHSTVHRVWEKEHCG